MDIHHLTAEAYNDIVRSDPSRKFPLEQSPAWSDFQSLIPGRRALGHFLLQKEGRAVAVASPLQLTMRGYSYVWLNQGPVWLVEPTAKLCHEVAASLEQICLKAPHKRPLFIRAHFPYIPHKGRPAYSQSLIQKTTVVDLSQNFETILAAMHQGARRSMRKAQKAGVEIREVPASNAADNFEPYYTILAETAQRDGFFVHPATTYQTMLRSLPGVARFFVAFMDDQPVAWALNTVYNGHAIYYYGASSQQGRQAEAPYLLHIEAMRQLQEEGIASYDFLGIGSPSYPGLQGVTQFKLKFGGPEVDYTPVYDIPLSPQYHPWKWAQALRRKMR